MAAVSTRNQFTKTAQGSGFEPVYVTDCIEGKHYVYPKIGPVLCKGVETMLIESVGSVRTFVFEELNARMPKTLRVPQSKLRSSNIRELAGEADLDAALTKIENADGSGFNVKIMGTSSSQARYEKMIASNDLNVLTELICKTLGCTTSDAKYKGRPTMGMEYGDRAACMIAAEYALVKSMDYASAHALFMEKSGKHNRGTGKTVQMRAETPEITSRPS